MKQLFNYQKVITFVMSLLITKAMKELLKQVVLKQSEIKIKIKRLAFLQETTQENYQDEMNSLLDELNYYEEIEQKLRGF